MILTEWYERWRHGRGFGVHSPLAYRLVREVLCPSDAYGYYIYDAIPLMRKEYSTLLSDRELRLIYRLALEFRPSSATIIMDKSESLVTELMKAASPGVEIKPADGEMIVCGKDISSMDKIAAEGLKTAFFTDSTNQMVEQLWEKVEKGHLYHNPTRAIIVVSDRLSKQRFEIAF